MSHCLSHCFCLLVLFGYLLCCHVLCFLFCVCARSAFAFVLFCVCLFCFKCVHGIDII